MATASDIPDYGQNNKDLLLIVIGAQQATMTKATWFLFSSHWEFKDELILNNHMNIGGWAVWQSTGHSEINCGRGQGQLAEDVACAEVEMPVVGIVQEPEGQPFGRKNEMCQGPQGKEAWERHSLGDWDSLKAWEATDDLNRGMGLVKCSWEFSETPRKNWRTWKTAGGQGQQEVTVVTLGWGGLNKLSLQMWLVVKVL